MVWGGISGNHRTSLVVIESSLNAQLYVNNVLRPHVVPFHRDHCNVTVFQQDNACLKSARDITDYLQTEYVDVVPWSPYSPDLNPTERLWDELGSNVSRSYPRPQNRQQLIHALQDERQETPQRRIRCRTTIEEYFAQLPNHKVPRVGTVGEKYRDKQLILQLPKQDLALAYCKFVEMDYSDKFEEFVNTRNEVALDIGYVKPVLTEAVECVNCSGLILQEDVAVIAPKFGEVVGWHPACFVCRTCGELLVDLTYCFHEGEIFCERHYAEQMRPRCAACDELIYSEDYTKAMSKDWHTSHFCCWQCDESLTGQRYVLRDEHPYCVNCYEQVFANSCEDCNKIIGIDSKDLSYKDKHWHETCFLCNKCRASLVDKPFGSKAEKVYCSGCYDASFASRCDGCGDVFRAGTKKMEYKGRQWHEKCFCCCICQNPIGTKSFIPRDNEIYCIGCYEEKFATRCIKCDQIITSGGVTYKNYPWHRECFSCTNCNTCLAGQRFTSRDDKPYCAECFGELFAKRCIACNRPITGKKTSSQLVVSTT
ncbi:LIM domain-containing protein unc-97-like [Limulus polyphemus]|uniref:LIM domain-containing protein unc-97-like n=1 Tax=Limulus polyphemus TaxID=6850 RepID=A0ABM1TG19_LIMPO|nr:LIM domain-containing protein unc-97-like [Limulus polyphemus]